MSPEPVLRILETPYRTLEGRNAPVQFASAVDPAGILANFVSWLTNLAETIEPCRHDVAGECVASLRKNADRLSGMLV